LVWKINPTHHLEKNFWIGANILTIQFYRRIYTAMNERLNIFQSIMVESGIDPQTAQNICSSIDLEQISFDDIITTNAYLCQVLDGFGLQNELVESVVSSFLTDQGLSLGEEQEIS
jgi:hypothetical protein